MAKEGKCAYIFSVFYIIFSALPESSRSEAYSRKTINIHPQSSYDPSRRFVDVLNHKEELDPQEELGFDLTPEEIIKFKIWPQGVVPYYIDVESFRDKVLRDKIRMFLGMVNSLTGFNFMELNVAPTSDERWVLFINRRGQLDCADHSILNFTDTGPQRVVLGYDCMSMHGELAEAVLSIAGVPPQHNAPNRDEYIEVLEHNIMPGKKYLFQVLKDDEWLFQEIPYDFNSAGHYHFHKYSVNGQATIKAKQLGAEDLSDTNKGLSNSDVRKIKMLYNFISKKSPTNMPECYKLFRPGLKFDQFVPKVEQIPHRKRPNEILSDKVEERDEGKSDDNKDPDEPEGRNPKEGHENDPDKKPSKQNDDVETESETEKMEKRDSKKYRQLPKIQLKGTKQELLMMMSDYGSD